MKQLLVDAIIHFASPWERETSSCVLCSVFCVLCIRSIEWMSLLHSLSFSLLLTSWTIYSFVLVSSLRDQLFVQLMTYCNKCTSSIDRFLCVSTELVLFVLRKKELSRPLVCLIVLEREKKTATTKRTIQHSPRINNFTHNNEAKQWERARNILKHRRTLFTHGINCAPVTELSSLLS